MCRIILLLVLVSSCGISIEYHPYIPKKKEIKTEQKELSLKEYGKLVFKRDSLKGDSIYKTLKITLK